MKPKKKTSKRKATTKLSLYEAIYRTKTFPYFRVWSKTMTPGGICRVFSRGVPAKHNLDLEEWIEKNLPYKFFGCLVRVKTLFHEWSGVVDPDTRKFEYDTHQEHYRIKGSHKFYFVTEESNGTR